MTLSIGNCGRCQSTLEKGDLRCPLCGLLVPRAVESDDQAQQTKYDDAAAVQFVRCNDCSAAVAYDAAAKAPLCAFCGSETHIEAVHDPMEQGELFVPFQVEPDDARRALRKWMGSQGFFRPSDLAEGSRLESMRPLYWAAWVFEADALVSWTADSDFDAGRSAWAPHAGQHRMNFRDVIASASRGLTSKETDKLSATYDLGTAKDTPGSPSASSASNEGSKATALVEQFEVQRSQARQRVLNTLKLRASQEIQTSGAIPGSTYRNVRVAPLLRDLTTRRFAFPAYVVAWRYKDELFRTVVSGQDVDCIVGKAPLSKGKVVGCILVILAAVAIALLATGGIAALS